MNSMLDEATPILKNHLKESPKQLVPGKKSVLLHLNLCHKLVFLHPAVCLSNDSSFRKRKEMPLSIICLRLSSPTTVIPEEQREICGSSELQFCLGFRKQGDRCLLNVTDKTDRCFLLNLPFSFKASLSVYCLFLFLVFIVDLTTKTCWQIQH